jgi:hypothetical protein
MKEVWKTMLLEAPKNIANSSFIIVHIAIDGTITGVGALYLTDEQKTELREFYKNNYHSSKTEVK